MHVIKSKLAKVERKLKKIMKDESNTFEYYLHLDSNLRDIKHALVLNNFNNILIKYEVIKNAKVRQIVKMNEK